MSTAFQQRYDSQLTRVRNRIDQRYARAEFGADPMHDHEPLADACEFIALADAALQTRLKDLTGAAFARVYAAWEQLQEIRHTLCIDEAPTERAIHVHGLDCGFPATCGFVGLEPEGETIHLPRPNGVAANGDRVYAETAWGKVAVTDEFLRAADIEAECGGVIACGSMSEPPGGPGTEPYRNWEC